MRVLLMHQDRDFDLRADPPPRAGDLIQDLELETLFGAMAGGDPFLLDVARRGVLAGLDDPGAILYRQAVLRDCLEQPAVVRDIYRIALEAIEGEKKDHFFGVFTSRSPELVLHRSVRMLELFVGLLKRLRAIADASGGRFRSAGFVRFLAMLGEELDDSYFAVIQDHLRRMQFRHGVSLSAGLGQGNKGTDHVLRRPLADARSWSRRIFDRGEPALSFEVAERDDGGIQALSELRDRGLNLVANALAQSVDHILGFFALLRAELGFYLGCLNLRQRLVDLGEPTCDPAPAAATSAALTARGLYDPCLALRLEAPVVGNDVAADRSHLVIVTGANQGGKSTFLRSVGLAYLMMQAGMFVAADGFSASVCSGVFTHCKREEDATMTSGKLDEELARMSAIVDVIRPGCVALFNESFASTNEREGSEIARQIVRALLEAGIRVLFVTHLFDLADGFRRQNAGDVLFLRAEREEGGRRSFKLVEGEPLPTSHGEDLYRDIFTGSGQAASATPTWAPPSR